jgi:carbonyl reductase 1
MSTTKRVAIVTGGNRGIGFALIKHLCKEFNGDVILCSRDESRGQEAVKKLQEEGVNPILQVVDVEDLETIKRLGDFLSKNYGGVDLIVNNAGVYFEEDPNSYEHAKKTVDINYFGVANICDILFPLLRPGGRVVHLSSDSGCLNWIPGQELKDKLQSITLTRKEIEDLAHLYLKHVKDGVEGDHGWPTYSFSNAYFVSKILVTALTFAQQREFDRDPDKDIVVNAVHPGYVKTDMTEYEGIFTPEESLPALSLGCFVPPKGQPRGKLIWEDATIGDWKQSFEELKDRMVNYYKIAFEADPSQSRRKVNKQE